MKKTEFKTIVEKNKSKDESKIAAELLKQGASLALISQLLNKTLVELGVKVDSREVLKAVRAEIKESDQLSTIATHRDLRLFAEQLGEKHAMLPDNLLPLLRKQLKQAKQVVPNKIKLGAVKSAVVAYFKDNAKPSLAELAVAIQKGTELKEEDALRQARMNFSFAMLLKNNQILDEVN